jgi:AraC-like DNA-binding protein
MYLNNTKNNAQSLYKEIVLDNAISVLIFSNIGAEEKTYKREIERHFIQFYFCSQGDVLFNFNNGNYKIPLQKETSLLLYNPKQELPLHVNLSEATELLSILIPIKKFHELFSTDANYIPFLSEENKEKKYYKQQEITPQVGMVLNQIKEYNLHDAVKKLYFKAKVLELLSLYFHQSNKSEKEQCPFLADQANMPKIKKAKEIIISKISEPPSLQALANEVGLPLNRLKEGFKQVYGTSVFSFLLDYKMEYARQLLASGSHNVNEVGVEIGYSTASHFIAAFKKKFGVTPKKYIMGLQQQ